MDSQVFYCLTTEDKGMKITLEFPCNFQDSSIISEVKSILDGMLHEYFEKELKA
ncbi:hypothetical protein C823_007041 [Eubacterium plexicaudatum ASF492]|uniref:Uncharacterized protein n=1 Tax=Eubacterium plexicaudatum ASF492 TaxID=1235802 RepID=N2AI48_9FIRM|nr:hypothetical protein C823_007041 [Eubacterium plexicaudatum ASF492]